MAKKHTPLSLEYDDEKVDRWMVSYADFVTLLFVLFLALYALLPRSIHEGLLGRLSAKSLESASVSGVIKPITVMETKPPEVDTLSAQLSEYLSRQGLLNLVEVSRFKQQLRVEMPEYLLFAPGTAEISSKADELVSGFAEVVRPLKARITVEGHTDNQPIRTAAFPSNWELSAARAAMVVRRLEELGLDRKRLLATGRADSVPRKDNASAEGRAENRRVTFYIEAVH